MRLIEKAFELAKKDLELDWKEISGSESNPLIIDCYRAVNGLGHNEYNWDDNKIPWCSCYVNKKIQEAGGRGTRSAWARHWLTWGKESKGVVGDIVVLSRGKSSGHVGFVYEIDKKKGVVKILGGNQSNDVNISSYPISRVLGYRTSLDA